MEGYRATVALTSEIVTRSRNLDCGRFLNGKHDLCLQQGHAVLPVQGPAGWGNAV